MKLDLPSPVPLPDDVRHRALDRVLSEIDEPAPRRVGWVPVLLVAAVAVAMVVGVTVALSPRGVEPALQVAAPPRSRPAAVDIRSEEGMVARCAAALGDTAGYPPAAQWRVTRAQQLGAGDAVLVVDDAFACLQTPVSVAVSPTRGTDMGAASVVWLAPAVVAVLNPERRMVEVDGDVTYLSGENEPVVVLGLPGVDSFEGTVTVEGSWSGPLPEPAPPVVTVEDRALPTRDPDAEDAQDVQSCVDTLPVWRGSRPELWTPVARIAGTAVPALLIRIGDLQVGMCLLTEDGPELTTSEMPVQGGTAFDPGREPAPQTSALLPVRVVENGMRRPPDLSVIDCTIPDGITVCGDPAGDTVDVRLPFGSGNVTVPRVPGRP